MDFSKQSKSFSAVTLSYGQGLKPILSVIAICALQANSIQISSAADKEYIIRQYNIKGNVALSKRSFQEAIDYYQEALKLDPNNSIMRRNIAVTHNNWALYLASRQQKEEAIEHWKQALKIDPGFTSARSNLKVMQMTLTGGTGGSYEPWEPDPSELEKANEAIEKKSTSSDPADPNSKSTPNPVTAKKSIDNSKAVIINSSPEEDSTAPFSSDSSPKTATYTNKDIFNTEPAATNSTIKTETKVQSESKDLANSTANTIGDRLDKLETKVYGLNNRQSTFIQRLEKLEKDILGNTQTSGSILERIKTLETNLGG